MQNPPFIHYIPIKISIYSVFPIFMLLWKLPINWNLHFDVSFQPFAFLSPKGTWEPRIWSASPTLTKPLNVLSAAAAGDLPLLPAWKKGPEAGASLQVLSPESHSWEVTRKKGTRIQENRLIILIHNKRWIQLIKGDARNMSKHVCACSRSVIQPRINRTNRCK